MIKNTAIFALFLLAFLPYAKAQDADVTIPRVVDYIDGFSLRFKIPRDSAWVWSEGVRIRSSGIRVQYLGSTVPQELGTCDASTFDTLHNGRVVPRWICRGIWNENYMIGLRLTPCLKEYAVYPRVDFNLDSSLAEFFDLIEFIGRAFSGQEFLGAIGRVEYDGLAIDGTPFENCHG